jgi:hypothetical protein
VVELSVTVGGGHAAEDVAERLRARGMEVTQVLDGIGVITGSASEEVRRDLGAVEGVARVVEGLTHQLPPPDAPVQ